MADVEISFANDVFQKFLGDLREVGERDALRILTMALNRKGHHAFVELKRYLVRRTGIEYDKISSVIAEHKAYPAHLAYSLDAETPYTNLREFKPYQGPRAFSAAPWGERHQFPNTFQPGAGGVPDPARLVYHRTGEGREIRPSFGPNTAVEMLRPMAVTEWRNAAEMIIPEIARMLRLRMQHLGPWQQVSTE